MLEERFFHTDEFNEEFDKLGSVEDAFCVLVHCNLWSIVDDKKKMTKEDIEKAVHDAEQYAAEDKKRREEVDLRNNADQMVYQAEKTINDAGDKLSEEDKNSVKTASDALKEALKGTDTEAIKAKQEELQKAIYAVGEKLYQQQAAQGQTPPTGDAANGGDDSNVYDAEFTEDK